MHSECEEGKQMAVVIASQQLLASSRTIFTFNDNACILLNQMRPFSTITIKSVAITTTITSFIVLIYILQHANIG
jgi:hypothetical protein